VTFASWIDELQEQEVDVAVPLTNDPLFHVYFVGLLVAQFSLNTAGQKMVPMFFIFFIFLFFEIFSLARISNASIKVESPGTQQHSRKGLIVLSLFVVK
jgi:hypothetical protein